jgi:hypothetical protein
MSAQDLQERLQSYSTPFLLEQYIYQKTEYTPEAIAVIEREIARRNISPADIDEFVKKGLVGDEGIAGNVEVRHFKREDFVKLDGAFAKSDGALIRAMFAEENIPHFLDADVAISPVGVRDADAKQLVHVQVHRDSLDKAMSLVGMHFDADAAGGVYTVKYSGIRDRLKSFSFQDIAHTDVGDADIVSVEFSREEKDVLLRYAHRLPAEIEGIENGQERIVFFFDNIEELAGRLSGGGSSLSKTDLLTALEILQIYCDEPDFPPSGLGIAEALLSFFTQ